MVLPGPVRQHLLAAADAGQGEFGLSYHAVVEVPDAIDDIDMDAREVPIDSVPDTVLMYLLPSRFCVSDVMANTAWELFGSLPPGWRRVQAIVEAVNDHLTFGYGTSSPTLTALRRRTSRPRASAATSPTSPSPSAGR